MAKHKAAMFNHRLDLRPSGGDRPASPWGRIQQPGPNGPNRPPSHPLRPLFGLFLAATLGILMGVASLALHLNEAPEFISQALAKPTLQTAERAFRNGQESTAAAQFTKLAAGNNSEAQYWLGHLTELGLGVQRDPAKAIDLYKQAADQNEVAAEVRLGEIYMSGDLVPPNFALAKSYLTKAAYEGDAEAARFLGQMYSRGLGTAVNAEQAYAWFEVSVLEGSTAAKPERDAALHTLGPDNQKAAIASARTILAEVKHEAGQKTAESQQKQPS